MFSSIIERCLCLTLFLLTTAPKWISHQELWSALIQCGEKFQLCVAIMIFFMSLAVQIFHSIMLVKLNSVVVVLENQDGKMLHGCGRKHKATTCSPAERSWEIADLCTFMSPYWYDLISRTIVLTGKHKMDEYLITTIQNVHFFM